MSIRPLRRAAAGVAVLATAGLLAACSSSGDAPSADAPAAASATADPAASPAAEQVSIVATTPVLGDIAGQIATCAGASIETLIPAGADSHDFAPSSAQVASMVNADLLVVNGLGLEGGMVDAIESAKADGARILSVGELVDPLPAPAVDMHAHEGEAAHADEHAHEDEAAHSDEAAHDHGEFDPHIWFDMLRMATAAELIGTELTTVTGNTAFQTCGTETADRIRTAEKEVAAVMASVPADRRVLVTDHLAYGYLADRYGYEVIGAVVPSTTTLAEPSSAELAELAALIVAENVPAIFANVAEPSTLVEAVAAETGRDVSIIPLYHDLGGPDSPAATYIDLMTTDASLIAEGLAG